MKTFFIPDICLYYVQDMLEEVELDEPVNPFVLILPLQGFMATTATTHETIPIIKAMTCDEHYLADIEVTFEDNDLLLENGVITSLTNVYKTKIPCLLRVYNNKLRIEKILENKVAN